MSGRGSGPWWTHRIKELSGLLGDKSMNKGAAVAVAMIAAGAITLWKGGERLTRIIRENRTKDDWRNACPSSDSHDDHRAKGRRGPTC
jgi:hypothetical protein